MLKKISAFVLLAVVLVACGSKAALNYNEDIVKKENALTPDIQKTEEAVGRYLTAGQYDSVAVAGGAMEAEINKTLDDIKAMKKPNAKGIDDFQAAVIKYFSFLRDFYTGYKNVGNAPTEEARAEEWQKLQSMLQEKNQVISDMQASQTKFANDNGFKVKK